MFNEHSIFFGVRFFSTAASKSPNFYKKLPRTLLVIFAQFLTFRFSNCSLVALRVSSLCNWPPEAKWTLKKLSSLVWISSKTGKLFELVFFGACFYFLCFFVADCAPARWWPCERQDVVLGQLRLNRRWTGWIPWCGFLQETGFVPRNVFYFLAWFWSLFLIFLLFWGRFCTCSLVASRVSRRCSWPAETK